MSYVVMARRYRPKKFEEVVGQESISKTLQNAITNNRIGHAYLFTGPRGVGKTSMARILSKALNCSNGPTPEPCQKCDICKLIEDGSDIDVVEIDAASNTGVDNIRELRNNAAHSAARARFKIYIIDEVHMLSKGAFNALLKTLEEPPAHVKFIFATTEPNKVPATVQSRCQRFDFRRISVPDIIKRLRQIAEKEKAEADEAVFAAIAKHSRGGMRDAQVALDQLIAFKADKKGAKILLDDVKMFFGTVGGDVIADMVNAIGRNDTPAALALIDVVVREGTSLHDFSTALIDHFRNILIYKTCGAGSSILAEEGIPEDVLNSQVSLFSPEGIIYIIQILSNTRNELKDSSIGRIPLEIAIVKACTSKDLLNLRDVLGYLKGGAGIQVDAPAAVQTPSPRPSAPAYSAPQPSPRTSAPKPAEPAAPVIKPAPPAAKPSEEAEVSTETIKARWDELLKNIRAESSYVYGLLASAQFMGFKDNCVIIGFDRVRNAFHQEMLSNYERRKIIEQNLFKTFNKKLELQFVKIESGENDSPANTPDDETKTGRNDSVKREEEEVMGDPAVKKVLEMFDGRLLSIHKK